MGEEGGLGVTSHAPGSAKSVRESRESTLTLPSEFLLWVLSFNWTFEFSELDYRCQNPSAQRVLYIIEMILKRICLIWVRMIHLDT